MRCCPITSVCRPRRKPRDGALTPRSGERVVVIERDADNAPSPVQGRGALVLVGDGSSRRSLAARGVTRGRHLVAIREDGRRNAASPTKPALAHEPASALVCMSDHGQSCCACSGSAAPTRRGGPFRLEPSTSSRAASAAAERESALRWQGESRRCAPHGRERPGRFGQALVGSARRMSQTRRPSRAVAMPAEAKVVCSGCAGRTEQRCERGPSRWEPIARLSTAPHPARRQRRCDVTSVLVCITTLNGLVRALVLQQHMRTLGVHRRPAGAEGGLAKLLEVKDRRDASTPFDRSPCRQHCRRSCCRRHHRDWPAPSTKQYLRQQRAADTLPTRSAMAHGKRRRRLKDPARRLRTSPSSSARGVRSRALDDRMEAFEFRRRRWRSLRAAARAVGGERRSDGGSMRRKVSSGGKSPYLCLGASFPGVKGTIELSARVAGLVADAGFRIAGGAAPRSAGFSPGSSRRKGMDPTLAGARGGGGATLECSDRALPVKRYDVSTE